MDFLGSHYTNHHIKNTIKQNHLFCLDIYPIKQETYLLYLLEIYPSL